MKTVIVYVHPWDGSFNHFVFDKTVSLLKTRGDEVDVIDLYKDGFEPTLAVEDLKVFSKGEYNDPMAKDYAERLKKADEVLFLFPLWWYGMPAMLKGFLDKVMLKGTAYAEDENHNLVGLLDISKGAVFTTANVTKAFLGELGDPIENTMIKGILKTIGISNVTWLHCPTVHLESARDAFVNEIESYIL